MKKFLLFLLIIPVFLLSGQGWQAIADTPAVNVYFFWGEGCPHCEHEKPFLEKLEEKYPNVNVYDFEVWKSSENRDLLIETGKALNANVSGVPFTVIGNQYVSGYLNDQTTGKQIEDMITNCMSCPDVVGNLIDPEPEPAKAPEESPAVTPMQEETEAPADEAPAKMDGQSEESVPAENPDGESPDDIISPDEPGETADTPSAGITAHFFYAEGCPLCSEEKEFLQSVSAEDESVHIIYYDVARDSQARELYEKALEEFDVKSAGLPFIAVGQQYFMGWSGAETEASIREAFECMRENHCPDKIQRFLYSAVSTPSDKTGHSMIPETLDLPLVGEIQTRNVSLPVLTIIIGALDGFNPCAMWTLLFLISLLLGMNDKRRMWILGTAFIVASAAVYFLFLAAWLNLLLFLGFVFWVRLMIGFVAMGGGGYYLKEFFTEEDATCKVTGGKKRQRIFERLRALTHESHFWIALGGIILLAIAVNLVELICSAGLPAVYTQILTLSDLAKWQYYLYLLLYIFIFMLDDLFVFFAAMITLRATGLSTKYARASHLIGGTLMVIIGILLIFKPEWLMFG